MDEKYPEHIMESVRKNIGLESDDISRDDKINKMSKKWILDKVCNWNGLIGYADTIIGWIEDIWETSLEE